MIKKLSQEDRLERFFKDRPFKEIPLNWILDMQPRIAQYGRAIHHLRKKRNMNIVNMRQRGRTWFKYAPDDNGQKRFS